MKRRAFLLSATSAAATMTLAGCGGGGGGAVTESRLQVPAGAVAMPFGSRPQTYGFGIKPTVSSNAEMDATIRRCYDAWKAANVKTVATIPNGLAIRFATSTRFRTVSEGMGMGMLLAVLMAGHDPDARALFDGLLTTVRARPAYSIPKELGSAYLMDWKLEYDGSSSEAAGAGWNAMDGDLDIALALLMADTQWGSSSGAWNYRAEAINTINALKAWCIAPDGTTKGMARPHVSRTSDYMIGHFRSFKKATGDAVWDKAVDRAFELVDRMQTRFSPDCGLMPDFIINTTTDAPVPSPGGFGDFVDTEGFYYANAQRNPWRFGTDYVISGDARWQSVCAKLTRFVRSDTGGDPARMAGGYRLDGSAMDRSFSPKGMIGPIMVGAMVSAEFQAFLNAAWSWNTANFTTDYYDSELQLIPMIVASGNWWTP